MTRRQQIIDGEIPEQWEGGRVLGFAGYDNSRHPQVIFECDCGELSSPRYDDLVRKEKTCANGKTYKPTRSCGHLKKETYIAWLDRKLADIMDEIKIQMWVSAQGKQGIWDIAKEHRLDKAVVLHAVREINRYIQKMREINKRYRLTETHQRLEPTIHERGRDRENPRYPIKSK